ncbi:9096_t:CDS:2 [Paraglomus occultum]|uniref:9096_t:CDS:1 n=1 Tax=Paraglomus occultum TaxID=144539 RepID=A0A9N8Z303_9GLOM|nr:9096_t:CDS:2 [Paraglomus occultum]
MRRYWNPQEDDLLIELYTTLGPAWGLISRNMKTRTARQCSERWYNALYPGIDNSPLDSFERNTIETMYNIYGPKWSRIASSLPGRTPRMVKSFWYQTKRAESRIRQQMSIERLLV